MPVSRRTFDQRRLSVRAGTFVILVCATILALSGWREWTSRAAELKNAEVEMSDLARSLMQHAEDTVEMADTVLLGLVDRLERDGTGPLAIARLTEFVTLRKATMTRIHGLFVYGEDGRWLATSENVDATKFNNGDRAYFLHHRDTNSRETLIGRPVRSRSSDKWIITLTRRFNHPDGSFAGVTLMTVEVAYFSSFYAKFDSGPNGSINLMGTDGIVLARSPDGENYIGRDLSNTPLLRDLSSRPAADVYHFRSPLDGVQRISFYRQSERYPLLLMATKAEDDVLATWRREAVGRLAGVLALVAVIALLGLYLIRQLVQRQHMTTALLAKESDFRLLSEESSDMVARLDWHGRIQYVSPSCAAVVGWRADQLTGTPALAGVNPEDLPRVEIMVASLKAGEISDARIIYRTRHREKGEIWVESTMRATRSAETGVINGVVAISRDMTAHKNLESRLAELANLDGLTGIANRRQFDERLEYEWARARRDGTPLALLLIDVDHFKSFNDQYGHQAGDRCLQAVARALSAVARRPADLAARYGGEEFALIMPDTDGAGCAQVADRFRAALREAAVPHALTAPSGLVTASLGGVSIRPASLQGQVGCGFLLEAADLALYEAKNAGRDRLSMSTTVVSLPGVGGA